MSHGLAREEWERRFVKRIEIKSGIAGSTLSEVVKAELESWPAEEGDWLENDPEDAADSNLSYWDDDDDGGDR